jgi:hypothetical protein
MCRINFWRKKERKNNNNNNNNNTTVAMETAKMLKIAKHKNDHSGLLAKQKLIKLVRNNIHI